MFEIFINNVGYNNLGTVKTLNNKHQCILILFVTYKKKKTKYNLLIISN